MQRVPPHVYFVGSAIFHYLGPAFAVLLFARVDALGVAWLRIASAALVFALWRRPWRALARLDRRTLVAWGAVLALMNCCFYLAIDRLPLATVAAIEFLPVVGLAALGARTPRNAAALLLAVPGVYLLTGIRLEGEPLGRRARVRQRRAVRALHRARPPGGAGRGRRRARRRDARRRGGRDAARAARRRCPRSATRSRWWPASASGSPRR